MADKEKENGGAVVTREDLLKGLAELEGVTLETAEEKLAEPVVQIVEDPEMIEEVLKKSASSGLKAALDASAVLREVVDIVGLHVDETLETLAKSINEQGEFGMRLLGVIGEMKKSIDVLTEKVEKFGETPAGTPKSVAGNGKEEILEKGIKDGGRKASKQTVLAGLEALAKSAEKGSAEQGAYVQALAVFDATGEINDVTLAKAVRAAQRIA